MDTLEKRLLSEKEITKKFIEYQQTGNEQIREEIIKNYIYIVKITAKKISEETGFLKEDLESYGYEGLIRAIDRYDMIKNGSRINYITQAIRITMFNGFSELVEFGGRRVTCAYLLERHQVEKEYQKTLLEDPSMVDIILDRLIEKRIISEKYRQENKQRILLSIATNINQYKQSSELIDENPLDDSLIREESRVELLKLLELLPEKSREIIEKRFGFQSEKETLTELGEEYHMSPEGIRKIERKELKKLRTFAKGKNLKSYLDNYS